MDVDRWVNVVAVLHIEPGSTAHDVGDVFADRLFVPGNGDVVLFADLEQGTVTITVPVNGDAEVAACAAMLAGYVDPALGVVSIEITHHRAGELVEA